MRSTPCVKSIGTAAVLLLFVALAVAEKSFGVTDWEVIVTRWVHDRSDGWRWLLRPAMEFGNRVVAVIIAGAIGIFVGRGAGFQLLVTGSLAWLAAIGTKAIVRRPRITSAQLGSAPRSVVDGWSFPSGHTSIAWAVAVAIVLIVRPERAVSTLLVLVALLAGVARMYMGVHMPMEVAAGIVLGTGVAVAVDVVTQRRPGSRRTV